MGASQFFTSAKGKNANEAFQNAVENARYMSGHEGYTGTIAEKDSFIEISVPRGKNPSDYANQLMDNNDSRIRDKWGPAGCILIDSKEFTKTEKIPQPAKQTKVVNHAQKGTGKWVTYYVLYQNGQMLDKKEKKTEAIDIARKLALKSDSKVNIKIEKHLEGDDNLVAEISPNRPKPKTKKVKEKLNTYAFFGWASY